MTRCFKATLEYDGTEFRGFQWQHGERTVQSELEKAIAQRTGQTVRVTGAGRTDAGVHALGQVASFAAETRIPIERMAPALNSALPADISIRSVEEAAPDFSARFKASSRVYAYLLVHGRQPSALWRRFAGYTSKRLDAEAMQAAADLLIGEQDFAAFTNVLQPDEPTYRDVMRCRVTGWRGMILVRIEANAFLRGMVRNIVGTLVEVGAGSYPPERVKAIQATRNRQMAGPSAAPQGLCLIKVRYGERKTYARREITEGTL
ncbi:MAG TPA: tRNA pseudouridine(38-40) synthase TruA [Chthonomonadaceae bacterium]|nr:tRNA pseudouridine(38-40) synthase TruA [Chthonomonadaceae bacterium]